MKTFEAFGRAIRAVSMENKLWRIPVVISAVASVLEYIAGRGNVVSIESPRVSPDIALVLALLAVILRIPTLYYPTKAYQLRFYGRVINEGELLMESIIGGLKTIAVGIVYGIVVAILAMVLLIPAIVLYYLVPEPAGVYIAVAAAVLPVLFIVGIISMMVPAYVWTGEFSAGFDLIGDAWGEKKETMALGLLVVLFVLGLEVIISSLGDVVSGILGGISMAVVAGLIDGVISEVGNVIVNIAGVEMFLTLSGKSPWKKEGNDEIPDS